MLELMLELGLFLGLFLLLLLLHLGLLLLPLLPVVLASTKQEVIRINSLGDQVAVLINSAVLDEGPTVDDVDRGEGLIIPCKERSKEMMITRGRGMGKGGFIRDINHWGGNRWGGGGRCCSDGSSVSFGGNCKGEWDTGQKRTANNVGRGSDSRVGDRGNAGGDRGLRGRRERKGGVAGKAPVEGMAGKMVGETAGAVVVKRAFGSAMTVEAVMVVAFILLRERY